MSKYKLMPPMCSRTTHGRMQFTWFSNVFSQNILINCASLILMLFPMFRSESPALACSVIKRIWVWLVDEFYRLPIILLDLKTCQPHIMIGTRSTVWNRTVFMLTAYSNCSYLPLGSLDYTDATHLTTCKLRNSKHTKDRIKKVTMQHTIQSEYPIVM